MAPADSKSMEAAAMATSQQTRSRLVSFACALLLFDALFTAVIVARVPYTKIDWDAYMSQVTGFLAGERNYSELHGDTGPLVYPAGFLYVYSGIKYITGGAVFPAQIVFGVLYVINLALVLLIYIRTQVVHILPCLVDIPRRWIYVNAYAESLNNCVGLGISYPSAVCAIGLVEQVPWWALSLICLSKRVHSIFVLRLFNDCVATTLTHASIALMQQQQWYLALAVFSAAVSVKMNVLLLAPPLLLLLMKGLKIWGVLTSLACAAVIQLLVGMPFLLTYPVEYLSRAFNLGRVFIHFWSVNFKFVPENIFISKPFALSLLILHLGLLFLFAQYKWCRHEGGILQACRPRDSKTQEGKSDLTVLKKIFGTQRSLSANHILTVLFTGNFIGIILARSLHYQFYSWYFYSVPFLLWKTTFSTPVRLAIFLGVELCWNVYPSTPASSVVLLMCHVSLLVGLWFSPSEFPYEDSNKEIKKID